jgi:hypothetical protein
MRQVIAGLMLVAMLAGSVGCIALGVAAAAGGIGAEAGWFFGKWGAKPGEDSKKEASHEGSKSH